MDKINIEEIKELILNYVIKEYLENEDEIINYDTPLITGGYIDSFSMVSLLVYLENKFHIKIPPNKATTEAFNSIDNIVALLVQYLK